MPLAMADPTLSVYTTERDILQGGLQKVKPYISYSHKFITSRISGKLEMH